MTAGTPLRLRPQTTVDDGDFEVPDFPEQTSTGATHRAPARFSLLHVSRLPAAVRESRHRLLIAVLALHVPALFLLGYSRSDQVRSTGLLALPLLVGVLGARFLRVRFLRSAFVVLGLCFSSYAVLHLAHGAPEAALQALFVVALVALYQDPALLALGLGAEVLVFAVPAAVSPALVFSGTSIDRPWTQTIGYTSALVGVAAAAALAWRRDVPVPVFAAPVPVAMPQTAEHDPELDPELAEQTERARLAELTLARRQTSHTLMTNLARRNQSLIGRQLATLDELERDERDPDVLAGLFALDHLATRMRRNAENLLVLAGIAGATNRGFTQPVPVAELLRGAAAEVEQYSRVDVNVGASGAVAGHVVSDVAHLLAELLDNALACSPPQTAVSVGASATDDGGLRLWVSDEGIGMTTGRLAEHNAMLADPQDGLEVGATLGFPVVKRLAARHGITVTLAAREDGASGLVARVELPASVVVTDTGTAASTPTVVTGAPEALPGRRVVGRAPTDGTRGRRNELARDTRQDASGDGWFSPTPLPTDHDAAAADATDVWAEVVEPVLEAPVETVGPAPVETVVQTPVDAPFALRPARPRRTDERADERADEPSDERSDEPTPADAPVVTPDATTYDTTAHDTATHDAPSTWTLPPEPEPAAEVAPPAAALPEPRVPTAPPRLSSPLDTLRGTPAVDDSPALTAALHAWTADDRARTETVVPPPPPSRPPLARRVPQQALREAGGLPMPQTFEPGPVPPAAAGDVTGATTAEAEFAAAPDPTRASGLLSSYRAGLARARTSAGGDADSDHHSADAPSGGTA